MYKFAQALRRLRQEEKGFTLVELMVVVVIIGVLAAVAIPQFSGIINNSRVKADVATGKTIKDALDRYYTDNGSYPGTDGQANLLLTILKPTSGTAYLNSTPTVSQQANSPAFNDVFKYDKTNGQITVMDVTKGLSTGAVAVWNSGS